MKSQHTAAALQDLREAAGDQARVICAQNGVANERAALRLFRKVYGQLVILPAGHLTPGEVQHYATTPGGLIDVGCYPSGTDDFAIEVCAGLEEAGFSARPQGQIMRSKYAKLLQNLGNIVQAAIPPGDAARDLARRLRREANACFAAAGIDCASREEVRADNALRGPQMGDIAGETRLGGSTWQSVQRGSPELETDWLNGEIVLLGRQHGVPTPGNEVMQSIARLILKEGLPPGALGAEVIEHMIESRADNGA